MLKEYVTIIRDGTDEIVEKKSRFIGYVSHVETEEEAIAFVTEINNEIESFENDVNYKIDDFTCCVKNLMSEYIQSIDIKMEMQDNEIADAIDYMKNNIVETTTTIINQAIEQGELQVGLEYDEPTESLNIIVSRDGE